jgi:hypothetical protein
MLNSTSRCSNETLFVRSESETMCPPRRRRPCYSARLSAQRKDCSPQCFCAYLQILLRWVRIRVFGGRLE